MAFSNFSSAAEKVEFATHYDHAPFIVDLKKEEGLVFDLARYLSQKSLGRYEFQVTYVPRERLLNYLEKKKKLVIPFVSPKWFDDIEERRYLWSEFLVRGHNVVVTLKKTKFEYAGPDSLRGKTLGFVLGHKIPAVAALEKQGVIVKEVSPSMTGNFKKLLEGRVDFLITGEMIVRDLGAREGWLDKIHISERPFDVFDRKLLISPADERPLQSWLNVQLAALKGSVRWEEFLKRYHSEKFLERGVAKKPLDGMGKAL